MSFDGSARHFELAGNFGIVAALQKQFDDLLLAWSQPNRLLRHSCLLSLHFLLALQPRTPGYYLFT
jgi:hypothetical protein